MTHRPPSVLGRTLDDPAEDFADAAEDAAADAAADAVADMRAGVDTEEVPDVLGDGAQVEVTVELDRVALELARAAAVEEAGDEHAVGIALDAIAEDPVAVTARFAATDPGYRGWFWSVTLAVLDAAHPTVSEVVLLPGPEALTAPPWIPWEQRIRSGDLGVGDLLPSAPDDFRLAPGYLASPDPAVEDVALEVGLGRLRVMSRDGLVDTAERWHDGRFGPDDDMATHAPAHCVTCGFFLPLGGSLGVLFGACGNEYSPADGRVVDAGYGCGAHSEALTGVSLGPVVGETVVDELRLEVHDHPVRSAAGRSGVIESLGEPLGDFSDGPTDQDDLADPVEDLADLVDDLADLVDDLAGPVDDLADPPDARNASDAPTESDDLPE